MPSQCAPLAVSNVELEYHLVWDFPSPRSSDAVGLALDIKGGFLALAFKDAVLLYELAEGSPKEREEDWSLRCTYTLPDSDTSITHMSWASVGVLAVGFDTGDITLSLLDSKETILKGFQVSNYPVKSIAMDEKLRYMAVLAGAEEIGIWEFSVASSTWKPLNYIQPFQLTGAETMSAHWDSDDDTKLVVIYGDGNIVTWKLNLDNDEASPALTTTIGPHLRGGALSPDGQSLAYHDYTYPGHVSLLDLPAPAAPRRLQCPECANKPVPLTPCKFMFGGTWLLAPGVGHAHLWHVPTGTLASLIPLGPSHSNHGITHLSACGLRTSAEMFNLRIAAYATSPKPDVPPRVLIWKAFNIEYPKEDSVPLIFRDSTPINFRWAGRAGQFAWILVLASALLAFFVSQILHY